MIEKELCTGCGACAAACGEKAISMKMDRDGFLYPAADGAACTHCGLCKEICPVGKTERKTGANTYFGARAKDRGARLLSSSGGIFPLLAARIISRGGAVFGAALRKDGHVRHMGIRRIEDIEKISKTKYVQSDLSQIWEEIDGLLREKREVLFCGTPCQTAALRSYFGERRGGLLLIDLICCGVPSPGIWKRYVRFLEQKYGGEFQTFAFRDKRKGDNGHTASFCIGGKEYARPLYQDRFCQSYFSNVNIRPSCFQCRYCTVERASDITLGDFWGIERVKPGFDDGMGNSAVICHTGAGKRLWLEIMGQTEWFPCREGDVANDMQPRLREPAKRAPGRSLYMRLYRLLPFSLWLRLFKK